VSAAGRIGRPPLPAGQAKGALLSVRLSPEERRRLEDAADFHRERVSEWARKVLLAAAEADARDAHAAAGETS